MAVGYHSESSLNAFNVLRILKRCCAAILNNEPREASFRIGLHLSENRAAKSKKAVKWINFGESVHFAYFGGIMPFELLGASS
jgi:hypothetical protein